MKRLTILLLITLACTMAGWTWDHPHPAAPTGFFDGN